MTPATCSLCHLTGETAPAAGLRAVVPGCVRCAGLVEASDRAAIAERFRRIDALLADPAWAAAQPTRHAANLFARVEAAPELATYHAGGDLPADARPLLTGETVASS